MRTTAFFGKSKIRVVKDAAGIKYIISAKTPSIGVFEKISGGSFENALFLDSNKFEYVTAVLAKKDFYSFNPVEGEEFFLLEQTGCVRRFALYSVEGLFSARQIRMMEQNRRRKISIAVSAFFLVMLFALKEVSNAKKRKKIE